MKNLKILILLCMILLLSSCDEKIDRSELNFFALRHNEENNKWVRDDKPLFIGNDIKEYDWNKHIILFEDKFIQNRIINEIDNDDKFKGSKLLSLYYPDKFAFYIDDKELYRGYVEPQVFISFFPEGPMIVEVSGGIRIDCNDKSLDTRYNEKLKLYLKDKKLMK